MDSDIFKVIILIGRPAAGKSEVIDYLKKVPLADRIKRFHIGEFEEIDDFPYVWEKFEEDDILQRSHKERVWTTPDYYFKDPFLWHLFIEKINLAYEKKLKENPAYHLNKTAIIEFSRGGEKGFEEAFLHLSEDILKTAGIVYIRVSYEESVRKNRRRARPDKLFSILHHSLPDEKMEFYYKTNDWDQMASRHPRHIMVKGFHVPYAVLENEPEVTDRPEALGKALDSVFSTLWSKMRKP